ncbi:beta-ketoacyl synthase N-terminal-like domain-containing protein [Dactylosporangium sp. NPDC049742]|uniref:beta-ketoacyl synthase N-terminal-like domain-containing protein n=1 Tax=Dactylosporangium sp. NPDC049742 TaxID=3154737 RepID=UPI0034476D09
MSSSAAAAGDTSGRSTLIDHFQAVLGASPDAQTYRFLADGEGTPVGVANRDLDARARALAVRLRQCVDAGDRALIVCPPGIDYLASFLACLYARVVAVPVYPPNPVLLKRTLPRLIGVIEDSRPAIVLAPAAVTAMATEIARQAPGLAALRWEAVDRIDPALAGDWRRPAFEPGDIAFLQYTSGSTGSPKGVMLTHANLAANLQVTNRRFVRGADDTHLVSWLPPYHDMGLIGGMLQPLYGGFPVTFMAPVSFLKRPLRWLKAISEHGATLSGGPNFAYDLCVAKTTEDQRAELDLSTWRQAFCGAEPVRADTVQRFVEAFAPAGFRRSAFYPCYGLAEATLFVTGNAGLTGPTVRHLEAAALARHLAVDAAAGEGTRPVVGSGQPADGHDVAVVDPQTAERLPDGGVGEIWVSGPSVAQGYWGKPDESAATFRARLAGETDRTYLRTGDLGCMSGDELFVTGRSKDVIIIAGRNHYPQDIEGTVEQSDAALRPGSGVACSVDRDGEEQLVVVQEVAGNRARLDAGRAVAAIRAAVAAQHGLAVHDIVLVKQGSIPKTSSGKLQRGACREAFLGGALDVVAAWSAAGESTRPAPGGAGSEPVTASPPAAPSPQADTMRRAYATIERLQQRVTDAERARSEPIAIVGVGARFPGGVVDTESFWDLLSNGRDAVGEIPADRWDVDAYYDPEPLRAGKSISRWGGYLEHVDRFDHDFFGISRREAVMMDPQQRLILEVTWEALEDAGLPPRDLAGSATGVYMGLCSSDYSGQVFRTAEGIQAHASTGNSHGIATGRVSYLLDLKGPSVSIDTACSSSLVAVHQAGQALRLGDIDMAICGAVNVVLQPHLSISFSQFPEMLAADGRCKTFDAAADGFVRSEGCGVVVLKRLSDAVRDGDRIHALIRGSAVNQDGRSSGLTAPNGAAQRAVLRRALQVSGVAPEQLGYIETHGAGTKLGDPIEVEALAEVYGRPEGAALYLGAVKTSLGHTEAASGIAGLIKAVLCLEHGEIPPNLHFQRLNPHISFDGTTFAVPTARTPWPTPGPRYAGLSSFGFSGTNTHLILQQAPEAVAATPDDRRPASVLALSAKTETALVKLARRYQRRLAAAGTRADAADVCFSANTGRGHLPHRLAAVGASAGDLAARLADYARGEPAPGLLSGRAADAAASDVVFLFTGQGPQRAGMARELYETQPTFRRVLDHCDAVLRPVLDQPLLSAIYPQDPADDLINDMAYAQPGLFAVEYALAELWRSWGVEPAAVLGHSLGEYTAACFAGAMALDDALRVVAERGRLLHRLADTGAMAAVFASADEVGREVARHDPDLVSVAAANGPANTTISGTRAAVEAVCAAFTARGVDVRRLRISTSSHSPLIEPVLEPLRDLLSSVRFTAPRIPLVSNLTGRLWPWDQVVDAGYWCRHARRPVLFADGVATLRDLGYRTFLEVGPAPTLLGLLGDIVPPGADVLMLPSLRPKAGDWSVLLDSVSRLYVQGADLDWAGFDRDYTRARVRLPHYPFDKVRCWHDLAGAATPFAASGASPAPGGSAAAAAGASGASPAPAGRAGPAPVRGWASSLPAAEDLLSAPAGERVDVLIAELLRSVQRALGAGSSTVDPDVPLSGLGLDSLMAVELRNEIQSRLGVSIAIAGLLGGATIRTVSEQIIAQIEQRQRSGPGAPDSTAAIRRVARVEDLAEQLLAVVEQTPEAMVGATSGTEHGDV